MTAPQTTEGDLRESGGLPAIMRSTPITELADAAKQELEGRRVMVQLSGAIAALSWGKAMDMATRRAVAAYCSQYGIDPLTELDMLGGNLYLNAEFWLRKLGDLAAAGYVEGWELLHIQNDERIRFLKDDPKAPDWARERAQRAWYDALFERVRRNAPEEAEAICICRVKLKGVATPVEGCKWAGGGTSVLQPKHQAPAQPNPIAENNPTLSVESQAVRRAMRQIASHMPRVLPDPQVMDEELARVSARIVEADALEAGKRSPTLGNIAIVASGDDAAYGLSEGEPVRAAITAGPAGQSIDDMVARPQRAEGVTWHADAGGVREMSEVLGEPGGYQAPDPHQAALPLDTGEGEE